MTAIRTEPGAGKYVLLNVRVRGDEYPARAGLPL